MVLAVLPSRRRQRGITLIELLIAVALAGLVASIALATFKQVGGATRLLGGRMRGDFQAQTAFTTLSRNIMYGGGVIHLGENSLDLFNQRGRRVDYRWEDSSLLVNGRRQDFRLAELKVEGFGPPIPRDADGQPDWDRVPGLDTLDEDRDGIITFGELDRDGDGELSLEECRFLSLVRLTMVASNGEIPSTRSVAMHPRNRARDSLGAGIDSLGASDPFP
jgi:prepilin-type N-terminal cleavage/methylation domain-containing protein